MKTSTSTPTPTSAILELTKYFLWNGIDQVDGKPTQHKYLCLAVGQAFEYWKMDRNGHEGYRLVDELIVAATNGKSTMMDYYASIGIPGEFLLSDSWMQARRLELLNHMIKFFRSIND